MKRDRSHLLRATTAAAALAASVVALHAAEWPRVPDDSSEGATVWDPGPRWPTLASERPEGKPAGADAERRRAQPPPVAIDPDTTGSIRPRTRMPAQDAAAVGDLGPQWPNVAAEQPGPVPERRPAPEMSTVSSRPAMPDVAAPATVPVPPDLPATPDPAARQGRRAQPSSAAGADATGSTGSTRTAPRPTYVVPAPVRPFVVTVGGRYWYSRGKTDFGFSNGAPGYGNPTSTLDWRDNTGHAGEVFGRIDHRPTGIFVKGLIGGGVLDGGTIVDRDFFAGQYKFSDTSSNIDGKNLWYGIVDAGWSYDVPRAGFRVGGFVGYHYWRESLTASGIVTNADDFGGRYWGVPPGTMLVSDATAVFVYEPTWHALRLGVDGRWEFLPGWSVAGEVAWVPIAQLENKDSHLLRQSYNDLGPAPNVISRSSRGWGVEAEVFLNYAVTPNVELGVGGRFWGLNADSGTVAFGPSFVGANDLTKFEQQRYGLLVQAKGRF